MEARCEKRKLGSLVTALREVSYHGFDDASAAPRRLRMIVRGRVVGRAS